MKSFISWIGGKGSLISEILPRFPIEYYRYVEVFGGGASVLFAKKPKDSFEVYNDYQLNLVNLFRVVKEQPIAFVESLNYLPLQSREDFIHLRNLIEGTVEFYPYLSKELSIAQSLLDPLDYEEIKTLLTSKAQTDDVQRAVAYFKMIKWSYGSGGTSFGCRPINFAGTTLAIFKASERLKGTVIENKDFEDLIKQYDRDDTFFYCDPPYFMTEGHYEVDFPKEDHIRLRDLLANIQGMFLLSYNDCEYIRELYQGFYIVSVSRINNLALRYESGSEFHEVLIANYDITKKQTIHEQLNMEEIKHENND